ncbi:MAG: DNA adenine methylase [Oscillospiraceae bacterium]
MNSFIPWVGGKGKLLWIINKLMPDRYTRFIDVFGGSGTVTMCRPIQRGCMEVYNDFNSNLTNLFCCVKNRPMALLAELGFLPLNTRDDFNILYKFFSKGEFTDDYLQEEMDLTEVRSKPPTPRPSAPLCWSARPAEHPPRGGLLQAYPLQLQRRRQILRRQALRHPPFLSPDLGMLPQAGECHRGE